MKLVAEAVLPLFALILAGYVCGWRGLFGPGATMAASRLRCHEHEGGNRRPVAGVRVHADVQEARVPEVPQEAALVVPEHEGVADDDPHSGDDAERRDALHHDPEDVLPADEPAIEEREADGHQHHEGGAHEQERRIAGVDRHPEPPWTRGGIPAGHNKVSTADAQ